MGIDGQSGSSSALNGGVSFSATIHIRCSSGSKFSVQTPLENTVSAFKIILAERSQVPTQQQRLIYKGRILKDEQTLASYGLESDHTVHLVRGAAPSTTSANSSTDLGASAATNTAAAPRGAGSTDGGDLGGANGLFGSGTSGLFGSGFPDLDQVQQQLTQNPNMVRDMLNLPAVQNLMNNPDLVRDLITSNPQIREILDRNPDLAHVLNDPNTLRQTLEAARNPELMREMMRNTDRAMSNIESSPEGFNMLRRMYETVQEPFLNASTMAGNTGGDVSSNPFAALLGNQENARSRDRSTNPSTTGSDVPNSNPLPNPWNNPTGTPAANTRSTVGGEARSAAFSDLGLPNLEAGGIPDPAVLSQVLQNPAMTQMMQSLLSNPQYVNQIFNMNPQLRSVMESNTQLREMLQNPEFLRQLASPETMQQVLSLQQSLFSRMGQQQSNEGHNQINGATGMEHLMQLFGGFGGAEILAAPINPNVPPEELYSMQLSQLQEMGFFDTQENIRALVATAGNVHAAVERLLGSTGR
ncbi:hypothetical protein KSP40_PGU002981 [Platanthera guangdongensis]|uniref:Ubiquitin domain-containing protein DSK2a-like n=1 Tax=Platanthera guangdongensis TaxID=2320717 RepID=A0ABR2MP25_9ASPA